MADPLSLLGAAIAVVQLTSSCIKLVRSKIGPSRHSSHEIDSIISNLSGFGKAIEQFKTYVEAQCPNGNHEDEPFDNLDYLKKLLDDCKTALLVIEDFLNKGSLKQIFFGVKFDRKLKGALSSLREARHLFAEVVGLNNYASSLQIKELIKKSALEVQRLRQPSESDKVLTPELLCHYQDRVKKWLVPHGANDASQYEQLDSLLRTRVPGSCTWLFQHDPFRQWLRDNDAPPLLWIEGQPGLGKSVLCSTAIEYTLGLKVCTIFYYCRFDTQRTVVQAAGCLLEQLFDHLCKKDERIAHAAVEIIKKISNLTTDGLLAIAKYLIRELQRLEASDSGQPPKLLMFIDGPDEELREEEILGPFVFKLLEEFPSVLRVWVSSRRSQRLYSLLKRYPTICLKEHTSLDVRTYLEAAMHEIDEEWCDEDNFADGVILPKLLQRCQGNFLFARFLADFIKEESFRPNELPQKIQEKLPANLSNTYHRILQRYEDRKTASELFSIVAFARRPLRLRELEEAMAIIVADKPGTNLDPRNKPRRIDRMFYPLIEKIPNRDEPLNPFVQITHSSVKDYLIRNPRVLYEADGDENLIGERHIADACLKYLMQRRYSTPFDNTKYAVIETHHLLTYSAKYWDRHLNAIGNTPGHQEITHTFLYSQNFQTLLQVQSIALEFHFEFFTRKRGEMRLRKIIPQSLDEKDNKIVRDYLHFVGEWKYFLSCSCRSEDGKCPVYEYRGEITRCLSGIMGHNSFLSRMRERNPSFMLHNGNYDTKTFEPGVSEGFSGDGGKAVIALSKPIGPGSFRLMVNDWNPRAIKPFIYPQVTSLEVKEESSNWFLYAGKPRGARRRLSRPDPTSFSTDLDMLRVGSQLFRRDDYGKYKQVLGLEDLQIDLVRYFEEFACRNGIVVIARRQNRKEDDIIQPGMSDSDVEYIANIVHGWRTGDMPTTDAEAVKQAQALSSEQSGSESDDGYKAETDDAAGDYTSSGGISCDDMISSESEAEDPAEESLSEDFSQNVFDLNDSDDSEDSSEVVSDNYSDDSKTGIILSHGRFAEDPTGYVGDSSSDNDNRKAEQSSSEEDMAMARYARYGGRAMSTPRRGIHGKSENADDCLGSIAVLDISGAKPQQIFHHDYDLPVMLYHSPPVIHPSKPLVVWPLCGGDILFIDYAQKTHFTRRVLATTRFTRHVCMKVHFSECGMYMHVATIEAQDRRKARSKSAANKAPKNLSIAVFVTTYQLSEYKTAITLIHRTKARLGDITNISVSKLPITFTWTEDHVYVTQSSYKLTVTRIDLFRVKALGKHQPSSPMVPRETVLLPASAQQREVRYFPPTPNDRRGMVLIGSHRSNRSPAVNIRPAHLTHVDIDVRRSPYRFPSPPVGLYVDENKDLGGWVPARTGENITNRYRNGVLIRKIEPFDEEDDCELEDFVAPEDFQ